MLKRLLTLLLLIVGLSVSVAAPGCVAIERGNDGGAVVIEVDD